jgi:hypothetical protein
MVTTQIGFVGHAYVRATVLELTKDKIDRIQIPPVRESPQDQSHLDLSTFAKSRVGCQRETRRGKKRLEHDIR